VLSLAKVMNSCFKPIVPVLKINPRCCFFCRSAISK